MNCLIPSKIVIDWRINHVTKKRNLHFSFFILYIAESASLIFAATHFLHPPAPSEGSNDDTSFVDDGRATGDRWHHVLLVQERRKALIKKVSWYIVHCDFMTEKCSLHTRWRHQVDTFTAIQAFVSGIHRSPLVSPDKGLWREALMVYFICTW